MTVNSKPKKRPAHYVGVGSSTGGLAALREFLSPLPSDTDAAFIVVLNVSPDFKSMMPDMLSKHARMPVFSVINGMQIEPNCIYLTPVRKSLRIAEGKLLLSAPTLKTPLHMPIDVFLCSLAEDQQYRAIAIVLSGSGSDGMRGVKAIKESGGLVVVQGPVSEKRDSMPISAYSAYSAGLADMVLAPQEMARNIVGFIGRPSISGEDKPSTHLVNKEADTLLQIFKILKRQSSINFSLYKSSTVARRIERRLGVNQLTCLESYLRLLIDSPYELQILGKELLIGVTRFFRDDDAFAKIAEVVVPRILKKTSNQKEPIRIWVTACSTGEEAYSLAILFDEAIRELKLSCSVKIFATDVDEDAIADASNGVYSRDIVQDVSASRLDEYFIEKNGSYVVNQRLRQMVMFATHNLIEDPPFSNVSFVTCRNVLIYFQHSAQKKVLASLYFALQRDGILFLGGSESLGDIQSYFKVLDERSRIFLKVSSARVPIGSVPRNRGLVSSVHRGMAIAPTPSLMKPRITVGSAQTAILQRLIKEYAPDCIVLNELFEALHVYGDVSPYVKGVRSGKVSNNIKDMVVDDLSVAISTALYRCEKNEEDVFYTDVSLRNNDSQQKLIDLSVFIIKGCDSSVSPRHYIVQFIRQSAANALRTLPEKTAFDASDQSRQRIHDLERELIKKQEHLQVAVEELETSNEELQSANEELMSANEELQSTNEEVQSVNEELYTVNSEYQEKIAELTVVNDDLDSVVTATDIGIIFLDKQLTIRKFTAPISRFVHLRKADLNRPFHHISHDLAYDDLLSDITSVSKGGDSIEKEIISLKGHSVLVRIMPFVMERSSQNGGIIITMTNVSRLRFVEDALRIAQEQLRNSLLNNAKSLHKRMVKTDEVRVLLLDDDSVDRKYIAKLLDEVSGREFKVSACSEIDEALEISQHNVFDICLVDYQLAGGTAKDFTQKLRHKGIETPIVILSGYSEVGLDAEFLNTDIFDFLNKDEITGQLISRSIDYVLERRGVHDLLEDMSQI